MQKLKPHVVGTANNVNDIKMWKCTREKDITVSSMEKPFVHLIRVPEFIEVCITGNEKVKPNSLCFPGG